MRDNDRYRIQSVIAGTSPPVSPKFLIRGLRYWHRQYGYPRTIRRNCSGEIAHILDHSWAGLLPHVSGAASKVVTVHDLIPLRFPGELTPSQVERFRLWVAHLAQADAVIADSAYTKSEVEDLLKIPGEKIHVVPCGVDLPSPNLSSTPRDSGKGMLRLGSIGSTLDRKNLGIFPEALERLTSLIDRPIELVRVGMSLPTELATRIRTALGSRGQLVEMGNVQDDALPGFYASLDVVVIPSLYEGFGLPVIEGMAARIPVVSSNTSSLPEVGGDVALYFDPHSPEELASVLARVANEGVSQRQIEEGYQRAKALSWRSCLDGIYQVYDELSLAKRSRP